MDTSPLLFCHIPKTAGTSVRVALERVCPDLVTVYDGELRLTGAQPDFVRDLRERAQPPSILYGHFSFGVHRFLDLPARYATFLRQPLERVVSLYRHHAGDEGSAFHQSIAAGMTLGEFVSSRDSEETNNHMCRVIAGVMPRPGEREHDRRIVDTAVENLRDHFAFVGFVDRFADSMQRLEGIVGAPLARNEHVNASRRAGPTVTDADRRLMERENDLDIELFDRARELFSEQGASEARPA